MKVDGKVISAFISNPSAQPVIKFIERHGRPASPALLEDTGPGPDPPDLHKLHHHHREGVRKGAVRSVRNVYFDILMKEMPPYWPSNFPASHGNLRWFVTGAKVTDFARTKEPTKQPAGRFHSALANWFKASHTTLPAYCRRWPRREEFHPNPPPP